MTGEERVTYASVLRNREFAALGAAQGLSTLGDQLARIAIAVVVFNRTGSPFAASATYAISYLTYLLGGPVLSAISDRNSRTSVMVICDVVRAPLILVLCVDGIPLWSFFAVLGIVGLFSPPFDSARSALQPDLLSGESYVVGNALLNMVQRVGQVLGFLAGGALVAWVSISGALALDAATFLVSAGLVLGCIRHRAAAHQPEVRSSLLADTASGFRLVGNNPELRGLLAFALLGSAVLIIPEGLAVPMAHSLGGGALGAGFLTASVPAGFLVASVFVLRVPSERRVHLLTPLVLVSCMPLLLTPALHSVAAVAAAWFLAGMGGCVNLISSAAYVQACPREFRSRAYGVAITSLYAVQGGVLLASGALAAWVSPAETITIFAGCLVAFLALQALRQPGSAQGSRQIVRSTQQ